MDDLYVRLLLTFIGMIVVSLSATLYFWFSIRHFFYKEEDCYIPNLIFNNPFEGGNLPNNKLIKFVGLTFPDNEPGLNFMKWHSFSEKAI